MKFSTIVVYSLALTLFVSGCFQGNGKHEYITIGALLPLTGTDSDEGVRALNGIQIAKQEINEKGGIFGKRLDIIVLNYKSDEIYALHQYNILKEKGVAAIIGSGNPNVTEVLVKSSETDGIPIFLPSIINSLSEDQNGKLTDFEKSYFSNFSQIPLSNSASAYNCVFTLLEAISILEK